MNSGSLFLFVGAIIWGSTFTAQSAAMNYMGPHFYNAIRFFLGFLVLIPVALFFIKKEKLSKEMIISSIIAGLICGIPEFIASAFQQVSMTETSASKAGFLTALYIVMVPAIKMFFHEPPTKNIIIAVMLAIVGFYFLSVTGDFNINISDIYLVICALFFSFQILITGYYSKRVNPIIFSQFEFLLTAILSFILSIFFEVNTVKSIIDGIVPILYAGILSCGVAYTFQAIGQKNCEASLASLIMSLESVFAALCGVIILHNVLSLREIVGCILIFGGVLVASNIKEKTK